MLGTIDGEYLLPSLPCLRTRLNFPLATVNRIGNVRLVKPPLQRLPWDTWTCDHNLELWMVNAFFRAYDYPDIWQQITQRRPDNTLDVRLSTIEFSQMRWC